MEKRGRKVINEEVTPKIKARHDGGLDWGVTLEVVCELTGSRYASHIKTKGFVGEFSAQCNRKRKIKDDSKVLGLSKWTDGTSTR